MNKKRSYLILFFLFVLILPLISANLLDLLKQSIEDITGRGTNQATTVTITVGANAPNISEVTLNDTVSIVEGGVRNLEVSFVADDPDGNLENESAQINVSSGSTTVTNSSCTNAGLANGVINYTCNIAIQYYFPNGDWSVTAEINDTSNSKTQNNTNTWTLQQTTGMNSSVTSLTWPVVVPSAINQTSNNDPTVIENTGNKATLDILVQGIDLLEDVGLDNTTGIPAGNFSVFNATGGGDVECDSINQSAAATPGVNALVLINDSDVAVITTALPRGVGGGPENLYLCLFDAPSGIVSGTYSTGGAPDEEDWTISVQ